jgi:protein-disulfide isomerase
MPRRRRSASPGKRKRAWPSGGRFSTRARVIAGAAAALAVLAVLAVSELGGGSPGPGRAAPAAPKPPRTHPATSAANPNPSAHPITGPTPPPADPALTLGRPGAPVTIVEFGDYQCTNCGAFARGTEPALIRTYVDTGVARLVWRDFPWVDAQSVAAAVAARAAGMQGKFWAYHDYLFAHQFPDEHSGLVTGAYLRSVARRLGLNMTRFDRDVASPALAAAVRADDTFGQQLGVPGTPAFLIGGRPFFGAQTLAAFEAVIAQARKRR